MIGFICVINCLVAFLMIIVKRFKRRFTESLKVENIATHNKPHENIKFTSLNWFWNSRLNVGLATEFNVYVQDISRSRTASPNIFY